MTISLIIAVLCAIIGWVAVFVQRKRINHFNGLAAELIRKNDKLAHDNAHYLKFAEDVLQERDRANALYIRLGQGASVAQQILFRELQRSVKELNEHRQKAGLPPKGLAPEIQQLVDEYPQAIEATLPPAPPAKLGGGLSLPSKSAG